MDFHQLTQAVQYNDISWFLDKQTMSECLNASRSKTGDTLLHLVCRFGRRDVLELCSQQKGVDLQISNYEGKKPLHEAAQFGQLDCVQFLVEKNVQIDCMKRADWTPLMLACTKQNIKIILLLLKHGANPAFLNKDAWNCFHIAAREGSTEVLQKLLEVGPDLWRTVSQNGRTPLHTAALHGHIDAVKLMLERCHFVTDTADSCGITPLMDALRAGNVHVAQLLIDRHKAEVTKGDNLGLQPLHHAAQAGQSKSVAFLLDKCNVSINSATMDTKITPLHIAAKEGQNAVMKLLIEHGADVNCKDHKGRTALHIASGAQHADSVRLLLDTGCIDVKDSEGHLAQDLAKKDRVIQAFL